MLELIIIVGLRAHAARKRGWAPCDQATVQKALWYITRTFTTCHCLYHRPVRISFTWITDADSLEWACESQALRESTLGLPLPAKCSTHDCDPTIITALDLPTVTRRYIRASSRTWREAAVQQLNEQPLHFGPVCRFDDLGFKHCAVGYDSPGGLIHSINTLRLSPLTISGWRISTTRRFHYTQWGFPPWWCRRPALGPSSIWHTSWHETFDLQRMAWTWHAVRT